jgi:hypothetical protein
MVENIVTTPQTEQAYTARQLNPANPNLARSASVPAVLGYRAYVAALAKVIYYWGYPFVDITGRTSQWQVMKEPGTLAGLVPAGPMGKMGYLSDYFPRSQRWVVTPNNDTIYTSALGDLSKGPIVIQTPTEVPKGQYWTVQIADGFSNVIHQLGSRARTPGGKFLLVGPEWEGTSPEGFVDVLRMPTNLVWVPARCFVAPTPESRTQSLAVLGQIGMYPLSENLPGLKKFDPVAISKNAVYPPGVTPKQLAADPDAFRPQWVIPSAFWPSLGKALAMSPKVGPDDLGMAEQARTLVALYASDPAYKALLDQVALEADTELRAAANYEHVGVDAGNGWQRQENAGVWGSDWFGRAQAAVVYIMVNDHREAIYFIRATDADGRPVNGKYRYTITFPKGGLPPVDPERGGFWSLTMYTDELFMLTDPQNGRANIGTVNFNAEQLKFNADGSLTLFLSSEEPAAAVGKANWLPAPDGGFALCLRTYVPTEALLNGSYKLPNVVRALCAS